MARSIANGPPGLEVPHKLNGEYGSLVMNVRTDRPARIHLKDLRGYYALGDADDNREGRTGRRGESIYPSAPRGKTIVYIGEIQSRTQEGMRILIASLKQALAAHRNDEMKVQIQDPEVPWFFNARVIDFEMDDEQVNGPVSVWPWTRSFQLSLRLSDARFYVDNGGAVYASEAEGSSVAAVNEGSTDTDPSFVIQAKAGTPVVMKNNTTGRQLELRNHPSGTIVVDFSTREILRAGVDATRYLHEAGSTWWDEDVPGIIPGVNNIKVDGAEWGVSFLHASE